MISLVLETCKANFVALIGWVSVGIELMPEGLSNF